MAHSSGRKRDDEDEIGMVYRRPRKRIEDLEKKVTGSRFPSLSDGSPAKGFATLSHSTIQSWAHLRKAQGHNTRSIETPNAREDAPAPIELLEDAKGPYEKRVAEVLKAHGVPVKIRKNGGVATEDVFGASPEYWNRDGDWKQKPVEEIVNDPVVQAALSLARRKHGKRLISCSLHVDEESPHIHVVAVPLVFREHSKRGRKPKNCGLDERGQPIDHRSKVAKWTLNVTRERGLSSQLERNHDEWAAACGDYGLVRGERGSDMTLEERRARRNRQTGRASMAEKLAREKRDGLERAAFDALQRAEDRDAIAKKSLEEANAERAAAENASKEADQSRQDQRALEMRLNEIIALNQKMQEDAHADRKAAADLKKGLETRQAEIEAALSFLSRILDPEIDLSVSYLDGEMTMVGGEYDPKELLSLQNLPESLLAGAAYLLGGVADLQQDREQLEQDRRQIASDQQQLNAGRETYNNAREKLLRVRKLASDFHKKWQMIPPSERSPEIQAAVPLAKSLEEFDYPPGFKLPGRGGAEMG